MPVHVAVQCGSDALQPAIDATLERLVGRAARAAVREIGAKDAELSLTLLNDDGMADLNQRWLGHAGPTDVISFPLFEDGEPPVGDIYIGVSQADRQAAALGVSFDEELARLAIHGTLHVMGLDHPEGDERMVSPMWQTQERILEALMKV